MRDLKNPGEARIAAQKKNQEERYWLEKMSGDLVKTGFPYGNTGPSSQRFNKETGEFRFPGEIYTPLIQLMNQSDSRLFMILTASVAILLSRFTGSEDIILGCPLLKQETSGEFVNTLLALRNEIFPAMTFKELLLAVRKTVTDAYENQNYPLEILAEKLEISAPGEENPFFDVALLVDRLHEKKFLQGKQLNVVFAFLREDREIRCRLEYNSCRYEEWRIHGMISGLMNILKQVLRDVNLPLAGIEILTAEEKQQLLSGFNGPAVEYEKNATLHGLFARQEEKTPGSIALIFDRLYLSYGELDSQAGHVARCLEEYSIVPDQVVGIFVEKSPEMLTGILGILKAGGAYLPMDLEYPRQRIRYMLENSDARCLLTTTPLEQDTSFVRERIFLDHLPPGKEDRHGPGKAVTGSHLAYVIYTSGTTGMPKGVMVEHGNVLAYVNAYQREHRIGPGDTTVLEASYAFDIFVEEVFPALLHGGRLLMPTLEDTIHIERLVRIMRKYRVTVINCSPLMLNELNQYPPVESIRIFNSGGDVMKPGYIDRLLPQGKVVNAYGPTETTVCATFHLCRPGETTPIPIGKPIANYQIYILDKENRLVPMGARGELCIAGDGVARGYLKEETLTAEKFVPNPFEKGKTLYRTGDLGMWTPDGTLLFFGRSDHQIKVRGYRVELGEIETQLLKHPGVKDAVVLARGDQRGDKHIYAFIIPAGSDEITAEEIKAFLEKSLPEYMIPGKMLFLAAMPKTGFGKVDRKALFQLADQKQDSEAYQAPENQLEQSLVSIWQEVLGVEKIGTNDNFFTLGGHSLRATMLISKIETQMRVKIPLLDVFTYPSIKELAGSLQAAGIAARQLAPENLVALRRGDEPSQHIFFTPVSTGDVDGYLNLCDHIGKQYNCWGIEAVRLAGYAPQDLTIEEMASQYVKSIVGLQRHGPYFIIGWSFGAVMALEMVRQLEQKGEDSCTLGIIDAQVNPWEETGPLPPFEVESESALICWYLPGHEDRFRELEKENSLETLWLEVIALMEQGEVNLRDIERMIPVEISRSIPHLGALTPRELVYYINLGRSLDRAWSQYTPRTKLKARAGFCGASHTGEQINGYSGKWQAFFQGEMIFRELPGDHYSIMEMPAAASLAAEIEKILGLEKK